jgi:hypothetical protein
VRVAVHIERLVLDGIELTHRERAALGPTIERELRRRTEGTNGRAVARSRATPRVTRIGRDVAAAVHESMPKRSPR